MRAFGTDRVQVRPDGRIFLSCRVTKGWMSRIQPTDIRRERPGTAVLWDGEFYEVLAEEALAPVGVRYELAPWLDQHLMRQTEDYDEASEQVRVSSLRNAKVLEQKRRSANALSFLTGHLPAVVQIHMHHEVGTPLVLPTVLSTLPPFALTVGAILLIVRSVTDHVPVPVPGLVLALVILMGAESAVRLSIAWGNGRPCGSVLGFLCYSIFHFLVPGARALPAPLAVEKGMKVVITDTPPDRVLSDAFHVREPYLAFLSEAEQRWLAERFSFDPIKHGRQSAWFVLIVAGIGVVSTMGIWDGGGHRLSVAMSFLTALYLVFEQLVRLTVMEKKPSGSVIGYAIRPWAAVLFRDSPAAPPDATPSD